MKYYDIVIEASDAKVERDPDKCRWRRFKVRVLSSPAGDMPPEKAVVVQCNETDLQGQLRKLDGRQLDREGLISIGRVLALLLLPPAQDNTGDGVRELFARSLDLVGQDAGLRLRLRLPPELAVVPWEYVYLDRSGTTDAMAGFLALDPRVAIVRHEALPVPAPLPHAAGDITVLAALASPEGLDPLDLDREERDLREALEQQAGVQLTLLKNATLDAVEGAIPGMRVFHFAGHGVFRQQAGATPGTVTGAGALAFEDGAVDAEKLAMNLRGNEVRLVVLGGCETGRPSGTYVWGGIAPALVRFKLPAVVANQYSILDACAIAFSKHFYCALAGGLPIERAVSAGRIAAYNVDQHGRDWGVPVLYLRAADGQLFEGAEDRQVRAAARTSAKADVSVRVKEVAAGGFVIGAKLREMLSGELRADVTVAGAIYGTVIGVELDSLGDGSTNVKMQADTVGPGGSLTGAKIDTLGGRSIQPPRPAKTKSRKVTKATPQTTSLKQAKKRSARPTTNANMDVGNVTGGQVTGTQVNQRGGDTVHGNQAHVASGGQATLNTGIEGENLLIGSVSIIQGTSAQSGNGVTPEPHEEAIEERLRLDVALPKVAVVNEPFDLVIAVRQLEAPILTVTDLEQVVSAEGSIFRSEEHDVVKYRIEVTSPGFQVAPPSYLLKLRSRGNSQPIAFQLTSSKAGKRSLLVNAYQEDGVLAAQTRLTIEVGIAVSPSRTARTRIGALPDSGSASR